MRQTHHYTSLKNSFQWIDGQILTFTKTFNLWQIQKFTNWLIFPLQFTHFLSVSNHQTSGYHIMSFFNLMNFFSLNIQVWLQLLVWLYVNEFRSLEPLKVYSKFLSNENNFKLCDTEEIFCAVDKLRGVWEVLKCYVEVYLP